MKKSELRSRVKDFLAAPETDAEFIRNFLSNLQQLDAGYSRSVIIGASEMGLLAILFLLISSRGVGQFTIFGVEITQYNAISIAIPPIVAVILYRIANLTTQGGAVSYLHWEVTRQAYPAFFKAGLGEIVIRSDVPFAEAPDPFWKGSSVWKLLDHLSSVMAIIIALTPLAFFCYAFYVLFDLYHVANVFVWLSLLATLSFFAVAALIVIGAIWEDEPAG